MSDSVRHALVVGGAGSMGASIVARLASEGFRVTVADIDENRTQEVAERTGAHETFVGDLSDEAAVVGAIDIARGPQGLHALVIASGISPKRDGLKIPFQELTVSEWNETFAANLLSPFLLMREAYRYLPHHDGASITAIVSAMWKIGSAGPDATKPPFTPSGPHYSASKAGLHSLIQSVSRELGPAGIRCNGVSPGVIAGGMADTIASESFQRGLTQFPLGRTGTPEEIASVVSFLASSEASYITGEVIDVDGGWLPD